ncbi:hypothetical protein [Microbulbifer sp. 2205BS26-8]|uniref:hypothetical protein n=1 Tax=Microbulbifer sp. 2205BS26-8 TaxID=3064386 RepID=UPI00273D9D0A|nr:hypothetical protein [Microbulbifer sp. 2205BS26-8]MDP5209691.1 hypothetical protein [Microbulbifer sp. 2205BS26-8]
MSTDNAVTRVRATYPYQSPGRRVHPAVVGCLSLVLAAVLLALWLFLYLKSQEKPYEQLKGHRIATLKSFNSFLQSGNNRERVNALEHFLATHGVGDITPIHNLLRQGSGWLELREPPYAIPPREQWHNIVGTLALLRDKVQPLIGPVHVISAFRTDDYNRKLEHSDKARHRNFCGLDLIPKSHIGHRELVEELRTLHAQLGPESLFGLGLGDGIRFHIDTCGYRIW